MRYSSETMQFFWLGKKLFGGKFIRFMSGLKNETDFLVGQNMLHPQQSKINFACPGENILCGINPIGEAFPDTLKPGILNSVIALKKAQDDNATSYILMFDGKKVKRGGDVDLLGHEDRPLQERKQEKENGLQTIKSAIDVAKKMQEQTNRVGETLSKDKSEIKNEILAIIQLLSLILQQLRDMKKSKSLNLNRLKEKAGSNWRGSKFVYAIDMCMTQLYKIENCITKSIAAQRMFCEVMSTLNGVEHLFSHSERVDLSFQENLKILRDPKDIKRDWNTSFLDESITKQRTEEWYSARKDKKVTGSTIFTALGCDGLKKQREHFDRVVSKIEPPEPSQEQKKNMKHGTDSEIHEIATICSIIMPVLFPDLVFYEEGCYETENILVSPDGSLRSGRKPEYALEGKAPVDNPFTTPVHYRVPDRYISQVLFEQRVLEANGTVYLSWSPESTTVFLIPPHKDVCNQIKKELHSVYNVTIPKRPGKISEASKEIKAALVDISKTCKFLGEFPSVFGYYSKQFSNSDPESPYFEMQKVSHDPLQHRLITYDDVIKHLLISKEVVDEAYELQRQMASQVIVVLLADLDRFWKSEQPHAVPIMYFFRGYSLPMDKMRKLLENCKEECRKNGLDIVACSSDGEFYPLMVRSRDGRPLSKFQLSKDLWSEVCRMKKGEILERFENECKKPIAHLVYSQNTESQFCKILYIESHNSSLKKICTPSKGWKDQSKKTESEKMANSDDENYGHMAESNADDINDQRAGGVDCDTTILYYHEDDTVEKSSMEIEGQPEKEAKLTEEEIKEILKVLINLNTKKWSSQTPKMLASYFESAETLKKFTVKELVEITNYWNVHKRRNKVVLKTGGVLKADLVNQLSNVLSDGTTIEKTNRCKRKGRVVPLKDIVRRAIMMKKYPKQVLNIAFCQFIWSDRLQLWYSTAHVLPEIKIMGIEDTLIPYYVPDLNQEGEFEVFVYDKTHLCSNLRKAVCVDKVDGISKKAWQKVSNSNPNILNPTLLEVSEEGKIVDQMKEALARNMFSKNVESIMLQNHDINETNFCKVIREALYIADDQPGISALERCRYRMALIKWLDEGVNFGEFPPYGSRIKGLSYILYEGLRTSMEAKLYLYVLPKKGTYCVRAANTLCSESFFSTMQEMDPWGQGILSTSGVEKYITDFTMVTAMKMKDDKPFFVKTKRSTAYPLQHIPSLPEQSSIFDHSGTCRCRANNLISCIQPRDHFFDTADRARCQHHQDKPFQFSEINAPARGDQPIRQQYGYRINEAKILPSKRLGLNLDDV